MGSNSINDDLFIVPVLSLYDSVYTVYRIVRNGLAELLGAKKVCYQSTCDIQSRCQHTEDMLLKRPNPSHSSTFHANFTTMF